MTPMRLSGRQFGSGSSVEGWEGILRETAVFDREAPLIVYGAQNDGPVFERLCPKCSRFMKFPKRMKWKEDWNGMLSFPKIRCSQCGPVEPTHVGLAGDFQGY